MIEKALMEINAEELGTKDKLVKEMDNEFNNNNIKAVDNIS